MQLYNIASLFGPWNLSPILKRDTDFLYILWSLQKKQRLEGDPRLKVSLQIHQTETLQNGDRITVTRGVCYLSRPNKRVLSCPNPPQLQKVPLLLHWRITFTDHRIFIRSFYSFKNLTKILINIVKVKGTRNSNKLKSGQVLNQHKTKFPTTHTVTTIVELSY